MKTPLVILSALGILFATIVSIIVILSLGNTTPNMTNTSQTPSTQNPSPPSNPAYSSLPNEPVIYVSIVTHSEDTLSPGTPDFSKDEEATLTERDGVAKFAAMLAEHGAKYNWQSDWNFLIGLANWDTGSPLTNNKNLAQYLVDDLGFAADPHSHQKLGYNHADVAYLIEALGVEPGNVLGGFLASPVESSMYEEFSQPFTANKYPGYTWKADALWGAATGGHVAETALWTSGIWIPTSNEQFLTPRSSGVPVIGKYDGDFNGLDRLLEKQETGALNAGEMYTLTITTNQNMLTDDYIAAFEDKLTDYADETAEGRIVWVTLGEALDIWQNVYESTPTVFLYDGDGSRSDLAPATVNNANNRPSTMNRVTNTTENENPPLRKIQGN